MREEERTQEELDEIRFRTAMKAVKPVPSRPTQDWATREMLCQLMLRNASLRSATLYVVFVSGIDDMHRTVARTTVPGKAVWRLLYEWDAAQPYMHLTPAQFRDTLLAEWAGEGHVLRARLRFEQRLGEGR